MTVLLPPLFYRFSDSATKSLHSFTPVVFHLSLGAVEDSISDAVPTQKVATALGRSQKDNLNFNVFNHYFEWNLIVPTQNKCCYFLTVLSLLWSVQSWSSSTSA
jgi:hypothetical protein